MSLAVSTIEGLRRFVRPGWRVKALFWLLRGAFWLVPIRRKEALRALRASFPDRDDDWCRRTLSRCYDHFSWMLVEYLMLQNDPSLLSQMALEAEGTEVLDRLKAQGKGCVILTGHCGNWELGAAWLCSRYPFETAVRDTDDPAVADLIERYRRNIGLVTLRRELSNMRQMIRRPQKEGVFMALLADQDGGPEGVPVTFLGRPCTMVAGPAVISMTAKVPLIPAITRRLGPFRHKIVIYPPLEMPDGGDRQDQIIALTQRANDALERIVLAAPEQWFWFHRRWKTPKAAAQGRWSR